MLGIVHQLWKPKPRRIKDYIADPKDNNYQSLHTTVFGLNGRLTEFQIRTKEMDEQAKYGIANHWNYKNKNEHNPAWIQELLLKQQKYSNDEEFYSSFTSEMLNGRIYVYTPKGDVIALPNGSTPVDFAYHVHTQVGNKCSGAIVNDLPCNLDYKLQTNDVIQIITDREQQGPKSEWLQFVKTSSARKNIWEYINKTPIAKIF
jgi:GTP pyrophosphokinase